MYVRVCAVLNHIQFFLTPWTVTHQTPLSLGLPGQEYTEELYKKDLHDPDNHNGVITDLEPDVLEYEVKWALESITTNKASEVMELQLSYFIS